MGKVKWLVGQLNLLEMLENFTASIKETVEDTVDYLSRGRILMSLAKEKAEKIEDTSYEGFFKKILEMDVRGAKSLSWEILIKVRTEARKLISAIVADNDEACEMVKVVTGGRVVIGHSPEMDCAIPYIYIAGMESGEKMMKALILDEGEVVFKGYGLKFTQFDAKRKTYLYSPPVCRSFVLNDLAFLVAAGIIYEMLMQQGVELEPFHKSITEELNFRRTGLVFTLTPLRSWIHSNVLSKFVSLYKEEHEKIVQVRTFRESSSEYARSYQTKANIPQKVLKAMEKSDLNSYFGFVEFDEDTDLKKVGEFEKQFKAFHDICFEGIDSSKNSIRFRKLGSHKASGLYYPGVKCLCVDFRILTSTVHEYGHLIDYELGCLSLKPEFRTIKRLYCEHMSRAMWNKSDPMYKQLKGSSKYSEGYYRVPTEIFARSFELYCAYVLGVQNDLLPDDFSAQRAVYPYENEKYMGAITEYFNGIFGVKTVELRAM